MRLSKVIHFGTNRKRICDFLLVRYCNPCPILIASFRDIASFLLRKLAHPPNVRVRVPVWPDRRCWGSPKPAPN